MNGWNVFKLTHPFFLLKDQLQLTEDNHRIIIKKGELGCFLYRREYVFYATSYFGVICEKYTAFYLCDDHYESVFYECH